LLSRLSFLRPLSLGEGAVPISGQFKNRKRKDTYDSACQYKKLQIIVPLFLRENINAFFLQVQSFPLFNSYKIAD
jgi:hypothetical protein